MADKEAKLSAQEQLTLDAFHRGVLLGAKLEKNRLVRVVRDLQEGQAKTVQDYLEQLAERLER